MATATDFDRILRLVPGYDPFATAGPGEWFDEAAAQKAIDFFAECLHHIEGTFADQPFILAEWQQAVVGNLFGWKRADGTRRFRECFVGVPRGNGKSPWAAGIALYGLFCDNEPGAQIYVAASEKDQAALVYRHARGMIDRDEDMDSRCNMRHSYKSVFLKSDPASIFKVVSSDAASKHGYAPHIVICEELHAWHGRALMEAFQSAFAKKGRRQPLLLHITTRDYARPSVCNEKWKHAQSVRDGTVPDSAFLPVIYEPGDGDDWTAESTWEKCNPGIDVTVDREALRRDCAAAQQNPLLENEFKRLHLDAETEQAVRWMPMDAWDRCSEEGELRGPCFGGLDTASVRDVAAFVLYWPETGAVRCWFWVPQSNAEVRSRRDRIPYTGWAKKGLVDLTPGDTIDYDYIRAKVNEAAQRHEVRSVGFDPYNATQLAHQLADEDGVNMVQFQQGAVSMNEPCKQLLKLAIDGELKHCGNEVLRWMASNVTVKADPKGNVHFDKGRSTEKIDGMVALAMAVGVSMTGDSGCKVNVFTIGDY